MNQTSLRTLALLVLSPLVACGESDSSGDDDIADLEERIQNLETASTALAAQLADAQAANDELRDRLDTLELEALTADDLELDFGLSGDISSISALAPYLQVDSSTHDVFFVGANVNIRSGTGHTEGDLNGLGNLIVGYNESSSDTRTGSHNLIVGSLHSYDSLGGIVGGYDNALAAPYSTAAGGRGNLAAGNYAFIGGGYENTGTDGLYTAILGGEHNEVSGNYASVAGGSFNTASGVQASIAGGREGQATEYNSAISGGYQNQATASYATVSGGTGLLADTESAHASP